MSELILRFENTVINTSVCLSYLLFFYELLRTYLPPQERLRNVPIRSSSEYGRRVHAPLEDFTARTHVRIDKVMKGFFRTNGTGIPTPATINDSKITTH